MGSLPKSTFLKAIKNHTIVFETFPRLIWDLINKHLTVSITMLKGNIIKNRKGPQSTQSTRRDVLDTRQNILDMAPIEYMCTAEEEDIVCFAIIGDRNHNIIYSNLTGRFTVHSYKCIEYIFVTHV